MIVWEKKIVIKILMVDFNLTPNSCLERKLKGIYEKQEKDANDTDGSKISCLTRKNKEVL